jgi:hypothetical protein
MNKVLSFIVKLVKEYGYKPLPKDKSELARAWYAKHLPQLDKDKPLYTSTGVQIATGFRRTVIGDYGAYIEIYPNQMIFENLTTKKGQEFRKKPSFRGKYIWLTDINDEVKVYSQTGKVSYADYIVGMFYISPYEVTQEVPACAEIAVSSDVQTILESAYKQPNIL